MKKIGISGIVLLAMATAASAADPLGEWRVEDGTATIKIVDCNSRLWGVVASEPKPGTDKQNPDPAKRARPTLGMPILLNMGKVTDEKDKWQGQIYNAQNGKTYDASIQLKSPNTLQVEGCVAYVLCGGQTWTRLTDAGVPTSPAAKGVTAPKAGAPAAAPKAAPATAPKNVMQKSGSGTAAPVSEVCLLPEVAGATH
jgi:uncharacterized protein (DUF2147 family)